MDDIIKLLQQLMSQKPKPKGGIADTAEGVEFLGKALSKEQQGSLMIVNSRLTDASRFEPFSIGNVGRDKRFTLISDYEQSLTDEFNKTVEFLKANPDIRLSQTQKDNIFYNLGVLRRISDEKNKLEKGIIEDGKKPSNVRDMEGNVLDPNEPIMGGTQEGAKKNYDDALFDQKAKNELQKNVNKQKEELKKINEIEELSQDLSKESNVDKILSKSEELKKSKTKIKSRQEMIDEAIDNVSPGFSGDLKVDADLVAEDMATRMGKVYDDLSDLEGTRLYGEAYDALSKQRFKNKPTFRLNADKFKEDFNVSDEELEKILALSPEEQQKVLQEYIDKDFKERIELSDFDVTDKEPNAQGGIVGLRIWSDKQHVDWWRGQKSW